MDTENTSNVLPFDKNFKPKTGGGGGGPPSNINPSNWLLNLDDGTRFFACPIGEMRLSEFVLFERFGSAVKLYSYAANGFDRAAVMDDIPDGLRNMMPKNYMQEVEIESWHWVNSKSFSKYMELVEIISNNRNADDWKGVPRKR